MRGFLDFSSWSGLLTTLFGLVLVSLVAVGIRLVFMQTLQRRQEPCSFLYSGCAENSGARQRRCRARPAKNSPTSIPAATNHQKNCTMIPIISSSPNSITPPPGPDELFLAIGILSSPDSPRPLCAPPRM